MSIPPSRGYSDYYQFIRTYSDGSPGNSASHYIYVSKVESSGSRSPGIPIPPRIKPWIVGGKQWFRQSGWVYPPKKRKILPETWRPPKPYSGSIREGDVTSCQQYLSAQSATYLDPPGKWVTQTETQVGQQPLPSSCILPAFSFGNFDRTLEDRAIVQALGKLKDSDINLAVAFAERAETAKLLVDTLSGLTKAARSLRKGDLRGVAKGLGLSGPPKAPRGQTFFQRWLELQYGWLPFYADVFGAVEALHKADSASPERYTQTVTAKITAPFSKKFEQDRCENWTTARAYSQVNGFEGASVSLSYYLRNPLLHSLSQLGITNPFEVLWERMPLSYLGDWFLPIGNYLSSMDAAFGFDFRGGSCTRIHRQTLTGLIKDGTPYGGHTPHGCYGSANSRSLTISRKVYENSPLPRIPSFKDPFPRGSTHVANAIALFASSLRG